MPDAAPSRVLVVGAGLTGALVSRSLRRLLPSGSRVVVWEADANVGGRMRCERHGTSVTDVGAQYITPTGDNAALCDELRRAGLLVKLAGRIDGSRAADGGGENFVSPGGLDRRTPRHHSPATSRRSARPRLSARNSRGSAMNGSPYVPGSQPFPPAPPLSPT